MKFGSRETFAKMKKAVSEGDAQAYNEVMEIVTADAMSRLFSHYGLQNDDHDALEIAQEVCVTVFTHAVKFVCYSENLSEGERDSWLIRVIDSKFIDHRKKYKMDREITKEEIWWHLQPAEEEDKYDENHDKVEAWVISTIKGILEINTDVRNVIAFMQNKIVMALEYGLSNGKPQAVLDNIGGKPLAVAAAMTVERIEESLRMELPHELKEKLYDRVREKGRDVIFEMTEKNISDKTSWMNKKLEPADKSDEEKTVKKNK